MKVTLFGYPDFKYHTTSIKIERTRSVALLAYVIVTGRPSTREFLATFLWPESPQKHALANLRNVVWSLNRSPLAGILYLEKNTLSLNPELPLEVDVLEFKNSLAVCKSHHADADEICLDCFEHLRRGADLYKDEFMSGFTIKESIEFEQWQSQESQSLESICLESLSRLTGFSIARQDWNSAIAFIRRKLVIFPGDEAAHRQLMEIYFKTGDRIKALEQFVLCKKILNEEFRTQPEYETTELARRIRSSRDSTISRLPGSTGSQKPFPFFQTTFVGRNRETRELEELIQNPECRLITLTGTGGSGKTRIARHLAARWSKRFPDGIFWVSLEFINNKDFVLPAIIEALHLKITRQIASAQSDVAAHEMPLKLLLRTFLQNKSVLLILDNAEHLIDGLNFLPEFLGQTSRLKVMITSRIRLNFQMEWVFEIAGLSCGETGQEKDELRSDAVELFVRCSYRIAANRFRITSQTEAEMARICKIVQGNPLAIELSSAWTKTLSCSEIASEITKNLDFLKTALKDVPERHQTFRAVFDHSWKLLSSREQDFFCRLSVFRGGFGRRQAKVITGAGIDILSAFVDKSILRKILHDRFEMHDLIRRYAEEQLGKTPHRKETIQSRHIKYYLSFVHQQEEALKGPDVRRTLVSISRDIENIRIACRWAAALNRYHQLRQSAISLFLYFDIRNRYEEGAQTFESALKLMPDRRVLQIPGPGTDESLQEYDGEVLRGLLYTFHGWFCRYSRPAAARKLCKQGVGILESLDCQKEWAFAFGLYTFLGEESWVDDVDVKLEKALDVFDKSKDDWGKAMILEAMSYSSHVSNPLASREWILQSLKLRRKIKDHWGTAMSLFMAGFHSEQQENYTEAEGYYTEGLSVHRESNLDEGGIINCLQGLARLALKTGNLTKSLDLFTEACNLCQKTGNFYGMAETMSKAAIIQARLGMRDQAIQNFNRSMELYDRLGLESHRDEIAERLQKLTGQIKLKSGKAH